MAKRIGVVGCKHTTLELIKRLQRDGIDIAGIVTLDPENGMRHAVADYCALIDRLACEDIPVYTASDYRLTSDEDRANFPEFDLLLVIGWQRLIPEWILRRLSIGAFGMHGSSRPLPYGRGRSPINWSLIQDKKQFFTHLFRYKPGVDDGDVVGVQVFDINPFDTCRTLHYKNLISMCKLCFKYLPKLLDGTARFFPQSKEGVTYYPKRTSNDSQIFWDNSAYDIYNHIRAVTDPFPVAFSFLGGSRVEIPRAFPFDTKLCWGYAAPGEVVEVFDTGEFVVVCGDRNTLFVERPYFFIDGSGLVSKTSTLIVGEVFQNNGREQKIWEGLPE